MKAIHSLLVTRYSSLVAALALATSVAPPHLNGDTINSLIV